jgi:hypothetical protein
MRSLQSTPMPAVIVEQGFDDVAFVLQGRGDGTPAAPIARRQDAPRGGVHGLQEIAVQGRAFGRREVDEHRFDVFVPEQDRQLAVDDAEPVAERDADAVDAARSRRRPADQAADQGGVVGVERQDAELHALGTFHIRELAPLPGHVPGGPCRADDSQLTALWRIHQGQVTGGNGAKGRRDDLTECCHSLHCEIFFDCHG